MIVNQLIAVVIGYLLGSIPSAYIAARLIKGKDIRRMGGGNVGALNTFQQVGKKAGVAVGIFDLGKGMAAVAIAYWLLDASLYEPSLFVLAAGFAAIVGHIWSIYLRFTGGNGLATTIGTMVLLMPQQLLIVLAIMLVLVVITRNPVLSLNISLISMPISAWLLGKSGLVIIFSVIVLLILILHFLPTAKTAIVKAGSKENFIAELLRRDRNKTKGR